MKLLVAECSKATTPSFLIYVSILNDEKNESFSLSDCFYVGGRKGGTYCTGTHILFYRSFRAVQFEIMCARRRSI